MPLAFPLSLPFCWSGHVDLLKNYKKNVLLAMERNCLWQNHPLSQVSPTFTEKVSKKVQKGKKVVIHVAERNWLLQNHPLSQVSPTFTEKVTKKSTKSKLLKRSKKILKVIHVAERNWLLQNQVYLSSFNGNTTHFCIV